jgi:predicted acetyltransferase
MREIKLIKPSAEYAEKIAEYRAEFPAERERVTYYPSRIPGMDYLEKYDNVLGWLQFCEDMSDKLTWYMAIRESDSKIVGFIVFRHKLEYHDDDIEFASNFGYSVCPSERGKGYAKEQLRLGLQIAKAFGLDKVRIVCRDINIGSNKIILANSGVHIDTIRGEKSGLNVNRYDIQLNMNIN